MLRSHLVRLLAGGLLAGAILMAQGSPGSSYGNWLPGQKPKKGEDANSRSVTGTVRLADDDSLVQGAVVQLKNMKSMQVRSFITKADGIFQFQGLATDVDYELKAESKGLASPNRTLSTFDNRKRPIIHLKLEAKK